MTGTAAITEDRFNCRELCNAAFLRQIATIPGSGRQSSATSGPHRAHAQQSRSVTCTMRCTPFPTRPFRKSREVHQCEDDEGHTTPNGLFLRRAAVRISWLLVFVLRNTSASVTPIDLPMVAVRTAISRLVTEDDCLMPEQNFRFVCRVPDFTSSNLNMGARGFIPIRANKLNIS